MIDRISPTIATTSIGVETPRHSALYTGSLNLHENGCLLMPLINPNRIQV